jgi:Mg2+ and Co2+ transporter CorA
MDEDALDAANLADMSRRIAELERIVAGLDDKLLGARRYTALVSLRGTANSARSEIHELFTDQLSELGDDQTSAEDLENRVRDCMSFLASGFERTTTEIRRSDSPENVVEAFED